MYGKSFEKFFDNSKKVFFQDTFLEKKFKKNLENFLRAENFSNVFFEFCFQKKCPEKNKFFECQKIFKIVSP